MIVSSSCSQPVDYSWLRASSVRSTALTRDVRRNVLRRVDATASGWRRRASNTGASLTVVVGGLVLLHQLAGQRRNGEQQSTDGVQMGTESPDPLDG